MSALAPKSGSWCGTMASMWTAAAVLLCLATGLQAAPERPDGGLSCPRSQGLFSHPTDCHKFLHCDHDHPYVKDCPANLHFNAKLMVCDWPENAGCVPGKPTAMPLPIPDGPPEPNMECDCECCLKPNGDDCTSYYLCKDGKAYHESCAAGLVFNPNIQNCDLPSNYQCATTTAKTTRKPTTTTPTTTTKHSDDGPSCPSSQGLFPFPGDCHKFIHCDHGHPYVKDCPANLHFNAKIMVCDWPDHAGCVPGGPTAVPPLPTPDGPVDPDEECDCECCLKPDGNDCTAFFLCKDGKAYHERCASGLVFNPNIQNCDLPSNYKCLPKTTPKATTTVRPTKPSGFDCPKDGLYPDPKDCHKFYHCSNGIPYHKDCPANLDFSEATKRCEWPDQAGCRYPATTTSKATTSKPTKTTKKPGWECPSGDGLFPDPKDCHKFYHCSNGIPYHKDCPANLDFNDATKRCDWPDQAGCRYPATTTSKATTSKPTKTTKKPGWECPSGDGLFPDPKDCHKFYHCSNGIPYHKDCPANLDFNDATKRCDWPDQAGCRYPATTTSKATTTKPTKTTKKPGWECPSGDGLFPDPKDCHKFYHCSNGIPYHKDCPANLDFSDATKRCEWPDQAGCRYPATTTSKATTTKPTKTTKKPGWECPSGDGLFPDPKDCHKFYHCSNGIPYHKDCPANLDFSDATKRCEWPDQAGCRYPATTTSKATTSKPTKTTKKPGWECPAGDGLFPDPKDCHKFYHCSNGIPYHKDCPANLDFNDATKRCDWPDEAGCRYPATTTSKATTSKPTKTTKKPGWECPSGDGLFPDPKDCHKFYHCSNGIAYHKVCPANLDFNPKLKVCDWPEHAGCRGPTPTEEPGPEPTPNPDIPCPDDHCVCRVPFPGNCTMFYECKEGQAYPKSCPAGLVFNAVNEVCDLPANVPGCKPTTTRKPTTTPKPITTPTPTDPSWTCPTSNGLYPDPEDCHWFYHCSNGMAYHKVCPANLDFNPTLLVCDWPEHAGCRGPAPPITPSPVTTPLPPPGPDVICPDDTCVCRLPDKYDCSGFYQCHDGVPEHRSCPASLFFNPDTEMCDLPSNVDCDPATTPKPSTTPFPFGPCEFPCKVADGVYPNSLNSDSYFQCRRGVASLVYCSAGNSFDADAGGC